ncbi:tetratricopeptide repeat protein [Candidatus Absconditicoccus praedator]|uniref:tetratricopeptide repeat protein n=1 Tax=Candidatus Absconditicoccus praedator TaxID=2735562 RepID=UPI001E61895F|nr:tetratricopeptide repeat protein [Candidatus Absconditicoccus praedator]UFX83442.1 tetratricopeptide repeat protein [Candidatus Absconditicoccus praedator]
MLELEIKLWLILTFIVLSVPVFLLVKKYILSAYHIIKNIYQKFEYKKNLENIKKEIIEKSNQQKNTSQESTQDPNTKKENQELLNKKIERIIYQAKFLKEKGQIESYEQKLIEGLSYDNENIDLLKMLSDLYFSLGNNKKALPLLKKVLEKDANDHKAIWQVGQIYFEKEDFQTAKLLINKAILLKNDNPKYHVSMAEIMYSLDDIEESINYMENAVKLRPHNINYLLAIASLLEEIGDKNEAKKYYFKVLESDQTNELAKSKVNQI